MENNATIDFKALATRRGSVRAYSDRAVEPDVLEYVLECARLAPSAVNRQPWHFVVVRSDEGRAALQACYDREWFRTAPLYVVVCVDDAAAWHRPCDGRNHADVDAAIATEHLCLAAASRGLGSCWVCNFNVEALRCFIDPTGKWRPVSVVPIGYPVAPAPHVPNRKPLAEMVSGR